MTRIPFFTYNSQIHHHWDLKVFVQICQDIYINFYPWYFITWCQNWSHRSLNFVIENLSTKTSYVFSFHIHLYDHPLFNSMRIGLENDPSIQSTCPNSLNIKVSAMRQCPRVMFLTLFINSGMNQISERLLCQKNN
jgi:hypothetical protein